MADKESKSQEYLKRHQIMELFENLTARLIYERPDDPEAFMKQFLEKLRDARTAQINYPCLFDDSNIRSLLGMLDVTGKGYVTYDQYKEGLETLGVKQFDKNPPGGDIDKIASEIFVKEARQGLSQASATFVL